MKLIDFSHLGMPKTCDFDNKWLRILPAGIDQGWVLVLVGIIILQDPQLRVLLECRFYSREGLI